MSNVLMKQNKNKKLKILIKKKLRSRKKKELNDDGSPRLLQGPEETAAAVALDLPHDWHAPLPPKQVTITNNYWYGYKGDYCKPTTKKKKKDLR